MQVFCVCKRCRPVNETLRQAVRRAEYMAAVRNYGREGAAAREAAKRERLAALSARSAR